jgi:hypothetical protein
MRGVLRTFGAAPAALLLLLAVACSSGGSTGGDSASEAGGQVPDAPSGGGEPEPEAAVLSAIEALGRSAEDFQAEVQSLRGEMTMDMSMGEVSFGMSGDFAFKAPDQMHMTMELSGGEGGAIDLGALGSFEMLVRDDKIYMNMPLLGGWTVATLDELGVDAEQYREMVNNHSPFDYADLVESFGDAAQVQDMGDEEIDGTTYRHYRIESDLMNLLEAVAGAFGDEFSGDEMLPAEGIGGAVAADIWLDSETMLPYKLTAEGSFSGPGIEGELSAEEMVFEMTIVVSEYNGDVTMPEPPADARPFSELGAGLFGDE